MQNLSDALVAATTDQKQIQRAARVGEQVRTVGLSEFSFAGNADSSYRKMVSGTLSNPSTVTWNTPVP